MDKIVYSYRNRRDVLTEAIMETLNYVYSISYPKPTMSFEDMCTEIHNKAVEQGKGNDVNFRVEYGKYMWPCDFFYIPHKVLKEVWDSFKEAYNIKAEWDENMELLIDFLFNKPGLKEVYSPTEWSNGENVRHSIDQVLVEEIIGKENAEKLKTLLEDYKHTYKYGQPELNSFAMAFLSTPSSNKDRVIDAWKELDKNITIPDDNYWMDEYEYSDYQYEHPEEFEED